MLLKTKNNIPHVLEMVIWQKQNNSCSFLKIDKISLRHKWNKMKKDEEDQHIEIFYRVNLEKK